MEQTFRYHRYVFVMAKKLPGVSLSLIGACWLPPLFLYLVVYREPYMPLIRLAFIISLTVVFMALLLAMVLNELCNTQYIVSDTGIIKKSPYKVKVVHFEGAGRFRYVKIPLFKGFGELSALQGGLRLPFLLDRLPQCISAIKQGLDATAAHNVYETGNINAFIAEARRYQAGIYRMQRNMGGLFQVALWNMIIGGFIAQVFWNALFRWVLCWSLISLVIPVAAYLITEALMQRMAARREDAAPEFIVDASPDDKADTFEVQAYRYAGAVTAAAYLVAGIVFKYLI